MSAPTITKKRLWGAERCCTCGKPRGLALQRKSWSLNCPTQYIPHTKNPDEQGDQITNDVIVGAHIYRNGGSGENTHLCDDCLRVGLRMIKLQVDELLGTIEAGADKDAELAELTARLALLQHHHQWLAYEHNRMQERLGKLLEIVKAHGIEDTPDIKFARFEFERGPAIKKKDEYLWIAPGGEAQPLTGGAK